MEATALPIFREQLLDRRRRLERAAWHRGADEVSRLLRASLAKMNRTLVGAAGPSPS